MHPKHAIFALLFLAGEALAHGSLHVQIKELTATMRRDGPSAPLLIKRARLQIEHGNNKAATQDFLNALKLNPQERSAYYYLAEHAFDQGKLPEGRRHAEKFLTMLTGESGATVRGQSLYGRILLAQGQYDAAAKAFSTAVEHAAEPSPEYYLYLADAQSKGGATEAALATLNQGMQQLGLLPVLQNRAIGLYIDGQNWDGALAGLDALIQQGQGLPELFFFFF